MRTVFARSALVLAVPVLLALASGCAADPTDREEVDGSDSAFTFGSRFSSPLAEGVYDGREGSATLTVYAEGVTQKIELVVNDRTCRGDVSALPGEGFARVDGAFDGGPRCHVLLQPSSEGGIYVTDSVHGLFVPRPSAGGGASAGASGLG